jgi:hypothetical protein
MVVSLYHYVGLQSVLSIKEKILLRNIDAMMMTSGGENEREDWT